MNQANLRDQLATSFNITELNDLCFDLNIDYQNIPGQTKQEKAREIITYCERHGLLEKLTMRCQELRPQLSWEVDKYPPPVIKTRQRRGPLIVLTIIFVGIFIIIFCGMTVAYLIQDAIFASTPPSNNTEEFIESTIVPTSTQHPLPATSESTNSVETTEIPSTPSKLLPPVQLPDGSTVTMFDSTGNKYQYTILSADREPLSPDKYLLRLRVRAWTDFIGGMNFWNDSFRLVDGDQRLAPVNFLNELAKRDETIDGDVEFEIDSALTEAILVITVGGKNFSGNTEELHLIFP